MSVNCLICIRVEGCGVEERGKRRANSLCKNAVSNDSEDDLSGKGLGRGALLPLQVAITRSAVINGTQARR